MTHGQRSTQKGIFPARLRLRDRHQQRHHFLLAHTRFFHACRASAKKAACQAHVQLPLAQALTIHKFHRGRCGSLDKATVRKCDFENDSLSNNLQFNFKLHVELTFETHLSLSDEVLVMPVGCGIFQSYFVDTYIYIHTKCIIYPYNKASNLENADWRPCRHKKY